MSHISYNYLNNMEAYHTLQHELYASKSSLRTLIFLAFLISFLVLSCGIIFSSCHWLLLTYPMMGLLIVSYWKHVDQYYSALRQYAVEEAEGIHVPRELHFIFTFFGIPVVEMKARLFTIMSLILGGQLFSLIMYMHLEPMSQTGIIFSLLNAIGIIFSVLVLSSRDDLQLVQLPKPSRLEASNDSQQMDYSLMV